MEEKNLSGEEKRKRMKEDFKKDLQLRQEFLEKVKGLRNTSQITQALNEMNHNDDTDSWIEKLNTETAFREAKTEIALDAANSTDGIESLKADQELDKAVAESMVEKMKRDLLEESKMETIHDYQNENGSDEEDDSASSKKTLGDF